MRMLLRVRRPVRAVSILTIALAVVAAGCGSHKKAAQTTAAAAPKAKGPPPPTQHFVSRPDLEPPPVRVITNKPGTAPGYIFLGPKMKVLQAGPEILDDSGNVVWFDPLSTHGVSDVKVQRYHGKQVITWWRGKAPMGVGTGYYAIYDDHYRQIARVRAGNGLTGDIHEFLITPQNTALFTVYHQLHVDLSPYGGPKDGRIFDGIVQEKDIATGKVLFEWHSYPTVGLKESYAPPPKANAKKPAPWDYFHVNSIDVEPNGNFLVSARNTHTIYEISRTTKKILWRLGGKKSSFKMGPGTNFEWQHDARRQADGTITLFDNGAAPPLEKFTRILRLRLDVSTKRATLVKSYHHPKRLLVPFEGNAQVLPDGHIFVGWGGVPYYSEFSASGQLLLDVRFGKLSGRITGPNQDADSYRAYKFVWHGFPTDKPAIAVKNGKAYVSWNGATEVRSWKLVVDGKAGTAAPKRGFETALAVPSGAKKVAVQAIDASGAMLAMSKTVTP
jgi:Arylsulfotransferase (ASST)